MKLNDLLQGAELDPTTTLVMRHVPREPELRKKMPWLAAERPDVFNAYQQTQGPKSEKQLLQATHLVSLIGHRPGKALFVGLFEMRGAKAVTRPQLGRIPAFQALVSYGLIDSGPQPKAGLRPKVQWFDLAVTEHFSKWKGKLIFRWPPPEISWSRWASHNQIEVDAILDESILDDRMPGWHNLVLTWDDLHIIPQKWKGRLAEWRGIYFILDSSTGKGYVGSAYGSGNILNRGMCYRETGHGNNKRLLTCDPVNLRFSILERVSPDMNPQEVIVLENSWVDRLHTRAHGLNGS